MNNTIKPIIFDLDDVRRKAEKGDKFACYILGRSYDSEENGAEQSFDKIKKKQNKTYWGLWITIKSYKCRKRNSKKTSIF